MKYIFSWFKKIFQKKSSIVYHKHDKICIFMRENIFGAKGLCIQIKKNSVKSSNKSLYYEEDEIIKKFYPLVLSIDPDEFGIVDEFNQNTKKMKNFIKWLEFNFPKRVKIIKK